MTDHVFRILTSVLGPLASASFHFILRYLEPHTWQHDVTGVLRPDNDSQDRCKLNPVTLPSRALIHRILCRVLLPAVYAVGVFVSPTRPLCHIPN